MLSLILQSFMNVIDALGGIEVTVPKYACDW